MEIGLSVVPFQAVPVLSLQNDVVLRVVLIFSQLNINTTLKMTCFK